MWILQCSHKSNDQAIGPPHPSIVWHSQALQRREGGSSIDSSPTSNSSNSVAFSPPPIHSAIYPWDATIKWT